MENILLYLYAQSAINLQNASDYEEILLEILEQYNVNFDENLLFQFILFEISYYNNNIKQSYPSEYLIYKNEEYVKFINQLEELEEFSNTLNKYKVEYSNLFLSNLKEIKQVWRSLPNIYKQLYKNFEEYCYKCITCNPFIQPILHYSLNIEGTFFRVKFDKFIELLKDIKSFNPVIKNINNFDLLQEISLKEKKELQELFKKYLKNRSNHIQSYVKNIILPITEKILIALSLKNPLLLKHKEFILNYIQEKFLISPEPYIVNKYIFLHKIGFPLTSQDMKPIGYLVYLEELYRTSILQKSLKNNLIWNKIKLKFINKKKYLLLPISIKDLYKNEEFYYNSVFMLGTHVIEDNKLLEVVIHFAVNGLEEIIKSHQKSYFETFTDYIKSFINYLLPYENISVSYIVSFIANLYCYYKLANILYIVGNFIRVPDFLLFGVPALASVTANGIVENLTYKLLGNNDEYESLLYFALPKMANSKRDNTTNDLLISEKNQELDISLDQLSKKIT